MYSLPSIFNQKTNFNIKHNEDLLLLLLKLNNAYVTVEDFCKIRLDFNEILEFLDLNKKIQHKTDKYSGYLKPQQISRFHAFDKTKLDKTIEYLQQDNSYFITCLAADFPERLKQCKNAPFSLFLRGNIKLLHSPKIAIVGARNASQLGQQTAEKFSKDLAQKGIAIVSGMASGIDKFAHLGAIDQLGGTIAVVGTGIDRVYPASNYRLAHQICNRGLLISEFPIGTAPQARNFPIRNRIVSGISLGVLVIEASKKSGSLITARLAGEQGKEIFAIPGSIKNPLAQGSNQLIKQGAHLADNVDDILLVLEMQLKEYILPSKDEIIKTEELKLDLSKTAQEILNHLDCEPKAFEIIYQEIDLSPEELEAELIVLEIEGVVEKQGANMWRKI